MTAGHATHGRGHKLYNQAWWLAPGGTNVMPYVTPCSQQGHSTDHDGLPGDRLLVHSAWHVHARMRAMQHVHVLTDTARVLMNAHEMCMLPAVDQRCQCKHMIMLESRKPGTSGCMAQGIFNKTYLACMKNQDGTPGSASIKNKIAFQNAKLS